MKKYNMRLYFLVIGLISFTLFCTTSCKQDETLVNESFKTLEGSWHISGAYRNTTDMIDIFDFSKFKLKFTDDKISGEKKYTIENPVPFIVSKNGSWSLDDPQYPFMIIFREDGATEDIKVDFRFPIIDGKRAVKFICSPGCTKILYEFTLEQDSII